MKRMLALILILLLLLTGCQKPVSTEHPTGADQNTPSAQTPVVPEQETVAPDPEKQENPEKIPEVEEPAVVDPVPAPAPEPNLEPEPAPSPPPVPQKDWAAYAAEIYGAIVDREEFHILVWQEDDSRTDLTIRRGVNDWNVETAKQQFAKLEWVPADAEDWLAMVQTEGYDPQLSFYFPGELSFTCCEGGDIVEVVDQTKITYLKVVNPVPEQNPLRKSLYGALYPVAENAVSQQVWNVTADGNLSPQEAAEQMLAQIAENYRIAPDWVPWKPLDVQADRTEVFDIYWGEPEEFCCGMKLQVKFEDPTSGNALYWQAGSGLDEPDAEGYCGYGSEVHVRKNKDGDWAFVERGTGGYFVRPDFQYDTASAEQLVELFCLTEGVTHDWRVPYKILELSDQEIATLPTILDQLTETEARALCTALGNCVKESDSWRWSIDILAPLLGNYGSWLHA